MKRTKELYFRNHPDWKERQGISGCTVLDGEDPIFDARNKIYQKQQKAWIDQQIREKEMIKKKVQDDEAGYASQILLINRMKGNLQDQHAKNHQIIKNSVKEENLLLGKQKKDKENEEKTKRLQEEQHDIQLLLERFKTKKNQNTKTIKPSILE